ncbi:MAG: glycoside hydrolase [Akkermansiaceae bacterium]|nr:glycoside hydrolase [Akkermansiaceae bacterium]MCF7731190.1 glycoside hydrolase [Akkermansiaceae bacterium]
MKRTIYTIAVMFTVVGTHAADQWNLEKPQVWTRGGEADVISDSGVHKMTFRCEQDWACFGFGRIEVTPGDVFETRSRVKVKSAEGGTAQSCATLYNSKGEALSWSWAGVDIKPGDQWQCVTNRFMIPLGVATLEPRIIGDKSAEIQLQSFELARTGRIEVAPAAPAVLENQKIEIAISPAENSFAVKHLRSGRVWKQGTVLNGMFTRALECAPDRRSAVIRLVHAETMAEFVSVIALDENSPEFTVTIDAKGTVTRQVDYPAAFITAPGERLIVPMNEGMSYPVDEEHQGLWPMIAYGGHGICMGFFGCMKDDGGSGWMCILETPEDASVNAFKGPDGFWRAAPLWDLSRGEFAYERRARYVFFDNGGHVAMCKRYRQYAKQSGLFKPFTEKVKERPAIDLLIGAANIWNWDAGDQKVELVKELQGAGMDRILWSGNGKGSEIAELNSLKGVLTGRYDIYQDVMDPARYSEVGGVHGDWLPEAFPQDINHAAPGVLRNGWEVERKDGEGRIACAVICDSKALPYARKRITADLKDKPFKARFLDTTVAAPWFECYHPDHPMTRAQSKEWKMKLLDLVSREFGLVCGSETGHEASVPFCDYFEGMLSLGGYRVHDAGRDMMQKVDEVPPQLAKYQVGEKYRLPLWELVYHDCVVAQWYWGDYNNKLPKVWRRRDLFNALYGTPPMYMFTTQEWLENRAGFLESYKTAQPVSRATGYSEMTDHQILTADRSVQQTRFANGIVVTVNFGPGAYKMPDGHEIKPLDCCIQGM